MHIEPGRTNGILKAIAQAWKPYTTQRRISSYGTVDVPAYKLHEFEYNDHESVLQDHGWPHCIPIGSPGQMPANPGIFAPTREFRQNKTSAASCTKWELHVHLETLQAW
jgi:hypothetical protein